MRNTKTPQGRKRLAIALFACSVLIEKYEDPAGDGNTFVSKNVIEVIHHIEKYEDPAGDGNPLTSTLHQFLVN